MTDRVRKTDHVARLQGLMEALEPRVFLSVGFLSNSTDLGSPTLQGSSSFASGNYTLAAAGTDIGGLSDQGHYLWSPMRGDGSIVARVASLQNTSSTAKAGLMVRSSTSATAAMAGVFVTPSAGVWFLYRTSDGTSAGASLLAGVNAPRFLRLSRVGNVVSAFHSADGLAWTQVGGNQSVSLGSAPIMGLAATSRNASTLTTAVFNSVSLLLPAEWTARDIGSPALSGGVLHAPSRTSFELSASGTGLGGTSDEFHLLSSSVVGDAVASALISSMSGTASAGGLMFRADRTPGSPFAAATVSGNGVVRFQWRAVSSGPVSSQSAPVGTAPIRLKITRIGDVYSAFYSAPAGSWQPVGTPQAVAMPSSAVLGGAMFAAGAGFETATFQGLSVSGNRWQAADVGSATLVGASLLDPNANTHTIRGSGQASPSGQASLRGVDALPTRQGEGRSDSQHSLHGEMTGEGSVVAYLNSIHSPGGAGRAGLEIRQNSAAGSVLVAVVALERGGVRMEYRDSAGGVRQVTTTSAAAAVTTPVGLRLVRSGNTFTGFYSKDGTGWLPVGSGLTLPIPATAQVGAFVTSDDPSTLATASFTGLYAGSKPPPGAGVYSSSDEAFLTDLTARSVRFFYDETNPATGMVPDGSNANGGSPSPVSSIAATGFGLSALVIAEERGLLTRSAAYQRALNTLNFLWSSGAHVNGFFYHFLNPSTGARAWQSEVSSIDTALLMSGVIHAARHWQGTAVETVANNLLNRVNWSWMLRPNLQYWGGWTPEAGFEGGYVDFSEAVLLYLLGVGASSQPAPAGSWLAWARAPFVNYSGFGFYTATTRALFTVQYPQGWFDLRGKTDSTGINYYNNAGNATLAQRQMAINMSATYPHWGPNHWGFTAADGPSGYTVWGGPPATSNIDGTVVPTAPGGSLAFVPRRSVDALQAMKQTYGATVWKKYGFVDSFNAQTGWTSPVVLGIDVGMMLLAAENSRSASVWSKFMQSPVAQNAMLVAFGSLDEANSAPQATSPKGRPGLHPAFSLDRVRVFSDSGWSAWDRLEAIEVPGSDLIHAHD